MSADFHTGTLQSTHNGDPNIRIIQNDGDGEHILCHLNQFIACGVRAYAGVRLQYEIEADNNYRLRAFNLSVIE